VRRSFQTAPTFREIDAAMVDKSLVPPAAEVQADRSIQPEEGGATASRSGTSAQKDMDDMTFEVPPSGSRGTRMPGGRMIRGGMRLLTALYRVTGGRSSRHSLILTTVGSRSGEERVASLRRFDEGDGRWLVVGSAGGAARHPAWIYNLARNPDKVWVDVGKDRVKVRPGLLHGDERATAWSRIVAEAPQFGGYLHKTDRELPVVRLTREA
jgi:deazaflavin-dependent oxidoreductase (nitroreductase family)